MSESMRTHMMAAIAASLILAACGHDDDHPHDAGTGKDHHATSGKDHHAGGEAHGHASPHGGVVKSIGDYHLELVTGDEGALTLHVLGADEKTAHAIAVVSLTAQAQPKGGGAFTAVAFAASSMPGEAAGSSSRFRAALPEELHGKALSLTVTVPIDGKPYRSAFDVGSEEAHDEHEARD